MHIATWLPYSLISTILIGVAFAFTKSPSAKGHSRFGMMFFSSFTLLVMAAIFFYSYLPLTTWAMIGAAAIWGVSFTTLTLIQMYALTRIDTSSLFPLTTTTALIITSVVGLVFFGDALSFLQAGAILIAVFVLYFYWYKKVSSDNVKLFVGLGACIVFLSTFNKIIQKIIATTFDIHAFQIYQYLFSVIFALVFVALFHRGEVYAELTKKTNLVTGIMFGVPAFFGSYALLAALTTGPISLINTVHSFYVLPTALVCALLFGEKLSSRIWFLVAGVVFSSLLIVFG